MDAFAPTVRKKYVPIPYPKGTPEHKEEVLKRARECKERNKEKYRPTYDIQKTGGAPPMPGDGDLTWDVPADLQVYVGFQKVTLPKESHSWILYRVKRHSQLASSTLRSYRSYWVRLPKKTIWEVCRELSGMENTLQNMYYKAALSFTCETLYNMIYVRKIRSLPQSPEYKRLLLEMQVYNLMNRKTMRASYVNHITQVASEVRMDNTVDWDTWTVAARKFVRAICTKTGATKAEHLEALAVAAYSYIPPIRLDWNDIQIRMCCGGERAFKGITGQKDKNIVYLSPTWAVAFWGDFKNKASFGEELPLRQDLPSDFHRVLKAVFPPELVEEKDYIWMPFRLANFGTYLSKLAKILTGKAFTNRLMRSSFIAWFHKTHNRDTFDLEKTRGIMRLLHQTNLEVHLGYNKFKDGTEEVGNYLTGVGNSESDSD